MKRFGLCLIGASTLPLYFLILGLTDAGAVGQTLPMGVIGWLLLLVFSSLLLGGIGFFLFAKR